MTHCLSTPGLSSEIPAANGLSFLNTGCRLLFRDYLTTHPDVAGEYQKLKTHLAAEYSNDRVAYSKGKMALSCR